MARSIYNLKLNENMPLGNNQSILRVPGGWVYGDMQGSCFVPFDNEFQENAPGQGEAKNLTSNNSASMKCCYYGSGCDCSYSEHIGWSKKCGSKPCEFVAKHHA